MRIPAAALMLLLASGELAAQDTTAAVGRTGALRIFLDCDFCDFDHLRTEMPWVSYVRDRTAADVHILGTSLGTGAGGTRYTIHLVGLGQFANRSDTLQYIREPNDVEETTRDGLTRTIQLGLVPYVMRTPQASQLRLSVAEPDEDEERIRRPGEADPWNAWVFSIGADGSLDREEQQNQMDVEASFDARRITDRWKLGIEANGEFTRDRFEVDDDRIVTRRRESYSAGLVGVRSLGPHWGAGAQGTVSSSTFQNTKLAVRAAPAVEYSVWPYDEATRRQLTMQYSVGVSSFDYREETIFSKFSETRPTQSFIVSYDVRQQWGEADAALETAGFLDDFSQYRAVFDGSLEIRLFRGLSLDIGGSASLIRDQLAIVKRDATPEEVLLELRALRTDYRYEMSVGFEYTFGSLFNSVVNPRFGGGPGSILR